MEQYEAVWIRERNRSMVMARACRDLREAGRTTVARGAESYWVQMARAYNDALCRSLHRTSDRFNSHPMPDKMGKAAQMSTTTKCEQHMCDGSGWRHVGWHLATPCYCAAGRANKAAIGCPDCGGTGRVTIDVPVYGNAGDVQQVEVDCRCQPPAPNDDDYMAAHAVDCGKGPIDWAAMAESERRMNRERAVALSDMGEPPLIESYDLPAHLLG